MDLDFHANYFALLGQPLAQAIDLAAAEARFREIQAQVHPDKHAGAAEADQRVAMQWATRVNEAWQTLKSPLRRARYLLQLLGHDAEVESNTAMPAAFLMRQMELREAVQDARAAGDEAALDAAHGDLLTEIRGEHQRLAELIDTQRDYPAATALVRQLMFQEKLLHDIDDALDAVTS